MAGIEYGSSGGRKKNMDQTTETEETDFWNDIDLAERNYLVCSMFNEAASVSSSTVKRIRAVGFTDHVDEDQLHEMMESAGMVFAQSMKALGRTSELFVELKSLYGPPEAIPISVLLTGACMQIYEGVTSSLASVLEEFLGAWNYTGDLFYAMRDENLNSLCANGCVARSVIPVYKYLEVAEIYAVTLLGTVLQNPKLAISWTENAQLPKEKHHEIMATLRSLLEANDPTSMRGSSTSNLAERIGNSANTIASEDGLLTSKDMSTKGSSFTSGNVDPQIMKPLYSRMDNWFSRSILRFYKILMEVGHPYFVVPPGKIILLVSLITYVYYILRPRRAAVKRILTSQVYYLRKALADAWLLAFSVQVNPLAALQPHHSAPN